MHGHHDHAAMFRRRFWFSLVLTVPGGHVQPHADDAHGLDAAGFTGDHWVGPGPGHADLPLRRARSSSGPGWGELRSRRPGMMLLISMGLLVAFGASAATTLDLLDADLWAELTTLVTIMLLGHWLEMRALGQAQGALAALAALLPDEAERVTDGDGTETVPVGDLRPGDVVLVRPGGRIPADGEIVDGAAEVDESMVTGESRPVAKGAGDRGGRRHRGHRLVRCASGSTRWATTPPWPASSAWWPRPRRRSPGPRPWPTGPPPCCSTSPSWPGAATFAAGPPSATPTRPSCAPSPCWSSPAPTPWAWPSRWS